MNDLFKTFGPWAFGLIGMWMCLKYLVTDKLKQIMAKLETVDRHEVDITEIKTVMRMNGCADGRCTKVTDHGR